MTPPSVPGVGPRRPMRVPPVTERTLPNGLRVIVARRTGIPRFEARLRIPTVRNNRAGEGARQVVLAETFLSGTPQRTSMEIAEAAQHLGGSLGVSADAESLLLAGSALSVSLVPFLRLMGEVTQQASFPPDEVAIERDRLVQEISLSLSQPESIARDALLARYFGAHPYGRGTPKPEAVARVRPSALRAVHAASVLPEGSVLVLVGDVAAARALDGAASAFGQWKASGQALVGPRLPAPKLPPRQPVLLVDRPGAVQTNIRLIGPAVPRRHPDFASQMLANAIFGGYFTSRLVDNIRERRGYTYSPGSSIEHRRAASVFSVSADVGTDVTAAALVEIRYELGRMVATLADQSELDAARRYLQGTLAMSIQTQAGLIAYLSTLAVFGLGVDYLRDYPNMLEQVTVESVRDVASRLLAPSGLQTVLVGDAATIRGEVEALDPVEVRPASS